MRLRPDFKQMRQEEAVERFELSQALTPQQRLNAIDERLGVSVGATKERARLQEQAKFYTQPTTEPKAKKVKKAKK